MYYSIRPMIPLDIPQVAQIERESFPTTWPPTPFKRELGNRNAHYLVASSPVNDTPSTDAQNPVAADPEERPPLPLIPRLLKEVRALFSRPSGGTLPPSQDKIPGYVGLWFMADEAHITSIAVREVYRRLGIGELLMLAVVEVAMDRRSRIVTLEARVSNTAAQALYEKYGFSKVGMRKRYYADNHEDAVIMSTDPIFSPQYQSLFLEAQSTFRQRWGEAIRVLA